jgi:hypothetical protein
MDAHLCSLASLQIHSSKHFDIFRKRWDSLFEKSFCNINLYPNHIQGQKIAPSCPKEDAMRAPPSEGRRLLRQGKTIHAKNDNVLWCVERKLVSAQSSKLLVLRLGRTMGAREGKESCRPFNPLQP